MFKEKLIRKIESIGGMNAKFTKSINQFKSVIEEIHSTFKFLENVNFEIEKLIKTYFKNELHNLGLDS